MIAHKAGGSVPGDEEAVVRILIEGLTSPAKLVGSLGQPAWPVIKFGKSSAGQLVLQQRQRPTRGTAKRSRLVEKVVVDDYSLTIKLRCSLLGGCPVIRIGGRT
jgi:hypothetical protein